MKVLVQCCHLSCRRPQCWRQTLDLTKEKFNRKTQGMPKNHLVSNCLLGSQEFEIVAIDDAITGAQMDNVKQEAETTYKNLVSMKKAHAAEETGVQFKLDELLIMLRAGGIKMPFDDKPLPKKTKIKTKSKTGTKVQRVE